MTVIGLPLIVADDPHRLAANPRTALADVIVTVAGSGSVDGLSSRLFSRYPGLTFTLVIGRDRELHIRSCDGDRVTVRPDTPLSIHSSLLRELVIVLHAERVRRFSTR